MRRGLLLLSTLLLAAPALPAGDSGPSWCGTEPDGSRRLLALHRYAAGAEVQEAALSGADADEDGVALLADRGDLVVRRNLFDLAGRAVRLAPNAAGGYDPVPVALAVDAPGPALDVPTDGARAVALPFAFPFFGARHTTAYVGADGRLTFGSPDDQRGEKGLGRLLAGPPALAAFFADLDPSRGGTVSALVTADRAAFVWAAVPGRGQINRNTFEIVLHASGEADLVYGSEMQTREGVAGASPGRALGVTPADLSRGAPTGAAGALLERFSESEKLDLVSVARRFYATHPDAFDQLVVYTTRPLNPVPGTLAFELNIKNAVRGIGLDLADDSAAWGSGGRLESLVYMDTVSSYLAVDGFEILAHEIGHRWLARLRFLDAAGRETGALLGRGAVHWSFFLDTQASVLEGNAIRDLGGGRFETVDFTRRYSALDQYAMGLRAPEEVPPFFLVEAPDDFRPNRPYKASTAPEAGVTFTGKRRDLTVAQVVAAMGPRLPPAAPRAPWRIAFLLVSDRTGPSSPDERAAVARIRSRLGPFYAEATDGRGAVDTTLP